MTILGPARPIPTGRDAEDLENGRKRFTRTYLVETDSPYDGPNVVLSALDLPQLYDPYDGHPPALCTGRFPRPVNGTRRAWHVECEWDTNYTERNDNPLLEKPDVEWDELPFDEPLVGMAGDKPTDTVAPEPGPDGKPVVVKGGGDPEFHWGWGILNAAGDPYNPPPTQPNYYPVVRYTRNEPEFFPELAVHFGNTANKDPWSNLIARQAWLKPIQASNQVHRSDRFDTADILYWRVRYTFVLKAETWDLAMLNVGEHYLTKPNTEQGAVKKRFSDLDGYPHMDLLKPDGTRFLPGDKKEPSFMIYRPKRAVDFAGLNINLHLSLPEIRRPRREPRR